MKTKSTATFFAILAAALYALNAPLSKGLLTHAGPTMMAAFLYLGAGMGLFLWGRIVPDREANPITVKEVPYVLGMIVLDIAAPILLMLGLQRTGAANASLLNNFEIVATSMIAWLLFREKLSRRLSCAIALVTLASIILGFEGAQSLRFGTGSAFVLAAACCWGLENNCTRMLSSKNPLEIVVIKGFGSGIGAFVIAIATGESLPGFVYIAMALLLGFVAYGLSIYFYIYAQRDLGAAKTSTYYAVAPFVGAGLSLVIFWEKPSFTFIIALLIMAIGTYFASTEEA